MPTYISLVNWTDKGVQEAKDTVNRADRAFSLAEQLGGKVKDIYWTVGSFDLVTIADFPDDATGTAFLLALGGQGNVRTNTMIAHTRDEMAAILAKTP